MNARASAESPSARRRRRSGCGSPSQSEKWMWQPLPALSGHGLGASEATSPRAVATARIVSRTSSCSSAARSAGACGGRDLLLAVAELGVVLLERDPLRVERGDEVVDVVLRRGRPDRREAERPSRPARSRRRPLGRERELVLERDARASGRARPVAPPCASGTSAGTPGAGSPSRATWSVSTAPACAARTGRTRNVSRSGTSRTSPTGPMPATGCSWSSAFIACMRDRQPDAAAQPALEAVARGRLGAHRAVVPAPQEADQAQAGLVELRDDVVDAHARKAKAAWRARCRDSAAAASGSRRGRCRPSRRARRCAGGAAGAR